MAELGVQAPPVKPAVASLGKRARRAILVAGGLGVLGGALIGGTAAVFGGIGLGLAGAAFVYARNDNIKMGKHQAERKAYQDATGRVAPDAQSKKQKWLRRAKGLAIGGVSVWATTMITGTGVAMGAAPVLAAAGLALGAGYLASKGLIRAGQHFQDKRNSAKEPQQPRRSKYARPAPPAPAPAM